MYMIIIKIDCCGCSQMLCSLSIWMLSDAMWAKGLSKKMTFGSNVTVSNEMEKHELC